MVASRCGAVTAVLSPTWRDYGAHEQRFKLLQRPGFTIGHFVCPPASPRWQEENVVRQGHVLAFPRHALEIAQDGCRSVVAAPGQVMFYNRDQVYRRALLDPRGDDCFFVGLPSAFVLPIVRRIDGTIDDRPSRPFPFTRGPLEADAFMALAALLRAARDSQASDDLQREERLVRLLDAVVTAAYRRHATPIMMPSRAKTNARHAELAETLERILSRRFREPVSLGELADEADTSPYHAARVFRRHIGSSLHEYRTRLRLHAAAATLLDSSPRLVELAIELGFSSHSHLCDAFARYFGCPPSAVHKDAIAAKLRMSTATPRRERTRAACEPVRGGV